MTGQQLTTPHNAGFAVAERTGSNLLKRIILKFLDSTYKANKTETVQQAPHGPAFAAVGVTTCWVHWQDRRPIEHRITQPGHVHPWREDLGDDDKTEWELGVGGIPSDPWRDTRYLYLIELRSGKAYTFVTDSVGGRQAVGELKDAIANVRLAQPGALPVVQLATGGMPTRYGLRPRPDFKIIDWRSGMSSSAPAPAQQQIEEQAEDDDTFGVPFDDAIPWK